MTADDREARVLGAVVGLVDTLLDDFDLVELLNDLTDTCARLLGVAAAGLLLADVRRDLHLMSATSQQMEEVEVFQLQGEEGPCLECYATGAPVSVPDLRLEIEHWPKFAPVAVEAGYLSVHALPLRAAGDVAGALGLFGTSAGSLSGADLVVGQTLAHLATVAILQESRPTPDRLMPRLQEALISRVVVEQAKGFLRERLGVSVSAAYQLLRRYAQQCGQHLTDVSRTLMSPDPATRQDTLDRIAALHARDA